MRASRIHGTPSMVCILVAALAVPAAAGWLRPLEGRGNFVSCVDVASFPRQDGTVDVVVIVAVENSELAFVREQGRWVGEVTATATLTGPDGPPYVRTQAYPLFCRNEQETTSPLLHQIFTLVLRDVPWRAAAFELDLRDANRRRPVLMSFFNQERALSQARGEWALPEDDATATGLVVADVIYLAHAPLHDWIERGERPGLPGERGPWNYVHPVRRYGLEEPRIQVYFPLSPPADPAAWRAAAGRNLLVEVVNRGFDFAMRDTIVLGSRTREVLASGGQAAIYYELDGADLPPGSYRLGIAPLGGEGRGYLGEFDVSWRLDARSRGRDMLAGEGRIVFHREALAQFEAATRIEQEIMLEEFWQALDPDPTDAPNEVYDEFRLRVAHVDAHLGGFGPRGARDDRGHVYILLGQPDQIDVQPLPMNPDDLEDARIRVHDPYAPIREGTWAKGAAPTTSEPRTPYDNEGGIPMPYSRVAEQEIEQSKGSPRSVHGYELWHYQQGGRPLFPSPYTTATPLSGLQFLFVDLDGAGHYRLESSNAFSSGN